MTRDRLVNLLQRHRPPRQIQILVLQTPAPALPDSFRGSPRNADPLIAQRLAAISAGSGESSSVRQARMYPR